jgi:hypothetical protein
MSPAGVREAELLPGTRRGEQPGVVLVLCQCCPVQYREILAEVQQGKLVIKWGRPGEQHYVVLGLDLCERLDGVGKIWCACCDPDIEYGRVLAECREGCLVIRSRRRHGKLHMVVLERTRLEQLLAPAPRSA